jgi:GntR family transcriptional repressor for pyruvate dehydrogenase complex
MEPSFKKAKPVRLFEQAVEQIKLLIQKGLLKPGDRLPSENELSQHLDVSRSSVREALRSLESKGIIQVRSGSGAFITENAIVFSNLNEAVLNLIQHRDRVVQVLQVRGAIERLSASLAAVHISGPELNKLQRNIDQQKLVLKYGDSSEKLRELGELDAEFHQILSQASRNTITQEIIRAIMPAYLEDNVSIYFVEKAHKLVEEHQTILDALAVHDPMAADESMHKHIDRVLQEVQDILYAKEVNPVEVEDK